ncbi:MAG TPA: ABC transporter ATP-binding protein [Clostridiales bacterium]|nr:MAG: hypothetical protein A2Y18_06650 [Clostridiales bacterium GWD2_32_19]HCC08060.1 ABC transporter ATP-binding protein [Clostridiales bacterium]
MLAIETKNIQKFYGVNQIFSDISFQVNEGERIAFVGRNGCGKTTLFKIITGAEDFKEGSLTIKKRLRVGYLDQVPNYNEDVMVKDVLNSAFIHIHEMESEMKKLEGDMSVLIGNELEVAMSKYSDVQHMFEVKGGYTIEKNISRVSDGLGFDEEFFDKMFNNLSGGEKTKVILAKILLEAPDVLLLDEPTNHLDIEAIEWLEDFIKEYDGTVLIVSHDRYFLDRVIDKVIEIEDGEADTYHGNYTYFVEEKERRLLVDLMMYNTQQKEIKQMEDAVRRFKDWGTRADNEATFKKMHNMEKRLEKMEKLERPKLENNKMRLAFGETIRTGNEVLEIKGYSKAFKDTRIFKEANLKLMHLDSAGILGGNGCGKSTIIKSILSEYKEQQIFRGTDIHGELSGQIYVQGLEAYKKYEGTIKLGANIKLAYLDQNIYFEDEERTVLEEFRWNLRMHEKEARNVLARFMFCKDDVFKRVNNLSGGEKTRLRLCQLIQQDINFLVLDEPTNHLDINSRQVLEQALLEFEGTILFISHDRYFINKMANKIFEVEDKIIKCYEGNYEYYRSEKEKNKAKVEKETKSGKLKETKLKEDRKGHTEVAEERIKSKRKQTIEIRIYELEQKQKDIDLEMNEQGEGYNKLSDLLKERWAIQVELGKVYEEWGNM